MYSEKISVIIPVYNVEKYLRQALDSVIKQTYSNLEIIIVDDGSTDSSLTICQGYAKKDNRIRIIHQENQGLSGARNTGIENATCDYLVFFDSDDEMLETMIEELYNLLKEYDADISVCSYFDIGPEETNPKLIQVDEEIVKCYSGKSKHKKLIYKDMEWIICVVQWNKLFKKKIFEDIRYPIGKLHEDEFVIPYQLEKADKVVYTNRKLYKYYYRINSIRDKKTLKNVYHYSLALEDRIDYYMHKPGYEYFGMQHYAYLCDLMKHVIDSYKNNPRDEEYYDKLIEIKTRMKINV